MRRLNLHNKYESYLLLDDESKTILKLYCDCDNFKFCHIHKEGSLMDIKYWATPCEHLIDVTDSLIKQGYNFKILNKGGYKRLSVKLKKVIRHLQFGECKFCSKTDDLEFHRLQRGNNNGLYNTENTILVCKEHHKLLHCKETGCY